MKRTYLFLAVIGTILPNIFVIRESILSGNYMLYARPIETFQAMFVNNISSAFMIDLLFIVCLFLVWTYKDSKKSKFKKLPLVWLYTFAFGIAGGLPLYFYLREKYKKQKVVFSNRNS